MLRETDSLVFTGVTRPGREATPRVTEAGLSDLWSWQSIDSGELVEERREASARHVAGRGETPIHRRGSRRPSRLGREEGVGGGAFRAGCGETVARCSLELLASGMDGI